MFLKKSPLFCVLLTTLPRDETWVKSALPPASAEGTRSSRSLEMPLSALPSDLHLSCLPWRRDPHSQQSHWGGGIKLAFLGCHLRPRQAWLCQAPPLPMGCFQVQPLNFSIELNTGNACLKRKERDLPWLTLKVTPLPSLQSPCGCEVWKAPVLAFIRRTLFRQGVYLVFPSSDRKREEWNPNPAPGTGSSGHFHLDIKGCCLFLLLDPGDPTGQQQVMQAGSWLRVSALLCPGEGGWHSWQRIRILFGKGKKKPWK